MEKEGYSPMMKHYLSVKEKYPSDIVFYRLGDFYEMFFDDAKIVSSALNLVLTAKAAGKEKVPMCGVPYHSARTYIERLINLGHKVVICEQVSDPKKKGLVDREVVEIVTPSTSFSEVDTRSFNYLAALVYEVPKSLVVICENSSGKIFFDWVENEVDTLIRLLLDMNVKEIVSDTALPKRWKQELQKQFIYTELKLVKSEGNALDQGVALLKDYLQSLLKKEIRHLQEPVALVNENHMILDPETKIHLELVQVQSRARNAKSLWDFLDNCKTSMGSRLLKNWIEQPLIQIHLIEKRQDQVERLVEDVFLMDELGEGLKGIGDLERMIGKIGYFSISLNEIVRLIQSLEKIQGLFPTLDKLSLTDTEIEEENKILLSYLEERIDLQENSWIRSGYDPQYDEILQMIENSQKRLMLLEENERRRTGLPVKIINHRSYGYLLELKNSVLKGENGPVYLEEKYGYKPRQSLNSATRFSYAALEELEKEIKEAGILKEEKEEALFLQIKERLQEFMPFLSSLSSRVARADVLQTLAKKAWNLGWVRPKFHSGREIEIIEGKHPVLSAGMDNFISNSWSVEERVIVQCITGPNMGGKSTFLRQNALLSILGQMGSFIPAQKAFLPVFDRIFTRIGASDDLLSGQSTFLVEMLETNRALRFASEKSLILLDEIGRGTSTYDGMALAQSIVEYIMESVKATTLFSTHYHELTEQNDERFENLVALVKEEKGNLRFLYRIVPGKADRSYGIQAARLAGLPEWVLARSKNLLKEYEGQQTDSSLSLFVMESNPYFEQIISSLRQVELDEMSPRQAFLYLEELKKQIQRIDEKN